MSLLLASLAFLLSGAAALVYQVGWQRILALHTGIGIESMSVIVAAFLAGLGLGSHWGGLLSLRRDAAGCLRAFAAVELAVGLYGALSGPLFYDVLYTRHGWLYAWAPRAYALHALCLLPPTTLMGMSLPLLVRGLVTDAGTAPRTIGLLYGMNVLGAAAGAFVTPWVLVPRMGFSGALLAAAAANLAAAAAGLALSRAATTARGGAEEPLPGGPLAPPTASGAPFPLWVALYAASGFVALALEVVWLRMVDVGVKSRPFTFGTVLALYLLGCAAGSLLGARLAPRLDRPLSAFLTLQALVVLYAALVSCLVVWLPVDRPPLGWFFHYWSDTGGFELGARTAFGAIVRLYLALPLVLFGPATVLMGLSFPILQRAVQDDPATAGRRVGLLQAANIAGCVLGSLLVGLLLLEQLGSMGTVRLLLALALPLCALGVRAEGWRSRFPLLGAAVLAALVVLPSTRSLWLRLHGEPGTSGALLHEDGSGVSALVPEGERHWRVLVNGRGHSWLPFGGLHSRLGIMPVAVHPAPVDVLIIGLGSGDTAWGAGARAETRELAVYEVAASQLQLLRALAERPTSDPERLAELRRFLADPRLRVRVADGRTALDHEGRRYDVIEADALLPDMSLSGNLYSQEFFELCARRLKPGGLMCAWVPTPRVFRTFRRAFPHVLRLREGEVAIGSNEPLAVDLPSWQARLEHPDVRAYLGDGLVRLALRDLATAEVAGPRGRGRQSVNTDLFPRDEFRAE